MPGRGGVPSSVQATAVDHRLRVDRDDGLGHEYPDGHTRVSEIQRARIIAAMVEESVERGVANVSVAHVVGRAGVSRRTFYEIFADREECFLAAFDDGIERASRYVLDGYDPGARWVERVRASLVGLLSFLDAEPGVGQLLIVGSLGAGLRALERRRRAIDRMIAVVEEGRTLTGTPDRGGQAGKQTRSRDEPLPSLTAEGVVGGVLSVLHARLLARLPPACGGPRVGEAPPEPLLGLTGALMSMIVLPYLGRSAARRELARPAPPTPRRPSATGPDPLRELGMRLTYRTVRVLLAVAATPGGSNRQVADGSGIGDQGQISKLLGRLHGLGLIENTGSGSVRGAPNSWVLTAKGWEIQTALARNT
jgi:AcrR family transcriptional regulator